MAQHHRYPVMLALALILVAFEARPALSTDGSQLDKATGCPMVFQGKCTCKMQRYANWKPDQESFVVNCTNSGFTSTTPLELLPNGTQILLFNGNNIPLLDWNLLGVWDAHEFLEVVDLSNNNITDITGKAFHKVSSVKRLILDHNNIKITGRHHHRRLLTNFYSLQELHLTNAFTELIDSKWYLDDLKDIFLASNMSKLYKLHLEQNEIWSITNDTFCGLPGLSDLYLGDNQLTNLDFNFECIKKLRFLDVQRNKIKRLDHATLDRIDSMFGDSPAKKINLNYNPWVCDCNLVNFVDWIKTTSTRLYRENDMRCYKGFPELNAGILFRNVKTFACRPALSDSGYHDPRSTTHALLSILIVLLVVLLVLVVFVNRDRIARNHYVGPLINNFQRSMQYSTIKNAFNDPPEPSHGSIQPPTSRASVTTNLPPEVNV